MIICHIDKQRSWTGQINRLFNLAMGLSERGLNIHVIAHPGSQLAQKSRAAGLNVSEIHLRGWRSYISILKLSHYLIRNKVDILHCHSPRDHLVGFIASKFTRIKHIVRTKHNQYPLKSGYWSRLLYRKCSKVIAISEYVRTSLIKDGIEPDLIETIYSAVDTDRFKPGPKPDLIAHELNILPDENVVGCVARLHINKGIEDILYAVKFLLNAHPDKKFKCLLVGGRWQRWAALAQELGIEHRLVFAGFRQDVPDLLNLFDIFVLPSRKEGLGTSIIEAMASGLPVIASNVGGIPELVTQNTGILVPPRDPQSLAAAMKFLLQDHRKRIEMGQAAAEKIRAEFSIDRFINHTLELYDALMADEKAVTEKKCTQKTVLKKAK